MTTSSVWAERLAMTLVAEFETTRRYKDVSAEKAKGSTYTPTSLAGFVADKILATAKLSSLTGSVRILDPAVGDGELLLSLLGRLHARVQQPISVHGFDTDEVALSAARRRLTSAFPTVELHLQASNFLEYILKNIEKNNTLSLFGNAAMPHYDLIIANPPYVRTQIIGARRARDLAEAFGLRGRVDLYYAFLIGIAQVLQPKGIAGIIVSNRFMTTKGGACIREALRTRLRLRHIWDLGDTKLFSAAVLPSVIIAQGRNGHAPSKASFTSIYETDLEANTTVSDPIEALGSSGIVAVADGRRFIVQHGSLDANGSVDAVWRIATADTANWLSRVHAHSWGCFRDIGKVRVGVKTCADKVFIRDDWDNFPANQRPELLRPLTTHHMARQFKALTPRCPRAILYPHEVTNGQRRAVDILDYPHSHAYLSAHRASLAQRKYVIDAGRQWYEIWVPQDPAAWSAPKLVFRDISEEPSFWIDQEGTVVNGDCYWIAAEHSGKQDLLWLAVAIANSKFIETFYDCSFNNKLYAGRRRFISQYVEKFPLPDPEKPIGKQLIALARQLYAIVDTPEFNVLKYQIDCLVWQAFGLPIEEVRRQRDLELAV